MGQLPNGDFVLKKKKDHSLINLSSISLVSTTNHHAPGFQICLEEQPKLDPANVYRIGPAVKVKLST